MTDDRVIETMVLLALPDRSRPRRRSTVFLFCHLEPSCRPRFSRAGLSHPLPGNPPPDCMIINASRMTRDYPSNAERSLMCRTRTVV